MKIQVIRNVNNFSKGDFIHVLPFDIAPDIDFSREIKGIDNNLVELGKFSKMLGGILLVGGISINSGYKKCSVFVFESGKLVDICDMNNSYNKFSPSNGFKIIELNHVKIGVVVDRDLYFPHSINALSNCGCSGIINLYRDFSAVKSKIACEFYSFVYGVDFVVVAKDKSFAFSSSGDEVNFKDNIVDLEFKRLYREVKTKMRGSF